MLQAERPSLVGLTPSPGILPAGQKIKMIFLNESDILMYKHTIEGYDNSGDRIEAVS